MKEIINMIIDLVFDKYCEMREVSYQQDKLVCKDLMKMKDELKEKINKILERN
jgi:hypothetical protein